MRFLLLSALVWTAFAASVCAAEPLTPAEAIKKVGEEVKVKMEVRSSRIMGDLCFLNSESDFRSTDNLTLFIGGAARQKFKDAKIDDPSTHFKGKTVIAGGKVTLYKERPQISLTGPKDIEIVEEK